MAEFQKYGFTTRNDLSLCRVVPSMNCSSLEELPPTESRAMLAEQLPIWIHNIISDPGFPQRDRLEMPLRRFEGELKDSKDNEVISAVLSAGFKNQTLNPTKLPDAMPLRQRCAMVAHIDAWREAYQALENDLIEIMMEQLLELDSWIVVASSPDQDAIMYSERSA
jgi:hypothetical protein